MKQDNLHKEAEISGLEKKNSSRNQEQNSWDKQQVGYSWKRMGKPEVWIEEIS